LVTLAPWGRVSPYDAEPNLISVKWHGFYSQHEQTARQYAVDFYLMTSVSSHTYIAFYKLGV
jgi:hypothetical protein